MEESFRAGQRCTLQAENRHHFIRISKRSFLSYNVIINDYFKSNMKQKPSFSGIQAPHQQRQQPLISAGKKPTMSGTSLAALMDQYGENDFSTISLKMNN